MDDYFSNQYDDGNEPPADGGVDALQHPAVGGEVALYDQRRSASAALGEVRFAEIPEHLRWKPLVVPNAYEGVHSRHLEPRKKPPPPAAIERARSPHNNPGQFHGVHPRYLEPRRAASPQPRASLIVKPKELKELALHEMLSTKLGFGSVTPRLLAWRSDDADPKHRYTSPRARVEQVRQENKRLHGFRIGAVNPNQTFDDHRARNKRLIAMMQRQAKRAPSPIAKYREDGTPLRHHTMGEHYKSPKRDDSQDRGHGKWVPSGGCGGGLWNRRANSPKKKTTDHIEKELQHQRTESRGRSVSPRHVPRVATLSPSHSLLQWEQSVLRQQHHDGSALVSSGAVAPSDGAAMTPPSKTTRQAPQYAIGETPDAHLASPPHSPTVVGSPTRKPVMDRAGSVFVGPVTLAVPSGTVVRVQTE